MNKDEIRQKFLNELNALQKEFNIPQIEIERVVLQFEDLIPLLEGKNDLLQQLSDELIDNVKYRANIGIPDTIPDDMIIENIDNQPNLDKVEADELEQIFGEENLNSDYDSELGRKGVMGEDYIPRYAEDFAEFTDGRITSLPDNYIFVFGSNTAGRHGKGAALDAKNNFGAIQGQGYGLQGQSFGIPTKDGQLNVLDNKQIQKYINNFLEFAKNNPDKKFVVTALGTGLAGKNPSEIASMFSEVPDNVILSQKFNIETKELKSLQTDSKSTDPLGKQLSAKTAVFSEGEYAGRSIEDVWQNTVKNKRTPGTAGKSGKPDGSGLIKPGNMQDSYDAYDDLWKQWFNQNPDIYEQAVAKRKEGYTFVDTFGKTGNVRQDETIMRIIDSDWKPNAVNKEFSSRIVPKDTPGSVLAMRGGDLPNPFYYQGGGPDAIVKISEGSTDANIAKVVELHKNWLETGAVPDGLSDDQIKRLADMRKKQLNIIDNLPDDYKLGYYKPDATTSHAITLDNFIQKRKNNGGSLGAARLNDPNIFPEKIEEYDPDIHKSFKESILDKMTDSERKVLDYINNHPTMQNAKLNGESLLLGLVKTFGADVFDKYNSLSKFNPVKVSGKLSKFLYRFVISVIDPIGEGIETAVKIGVKAGTIKDAIKGRHAKGDSFLKAANQGRKAAKGAKATGALTGRLGGIASNIYYELYNQLVWQGSAAMVATTLNASDALNSVLDKYGLLPKFVKENIDVIPYEDLNKHLAHQSRYWQSAGWQGSKLTSLWYILDTMLPAKTTGNTPHNWLINKMVMSQFPQRFELDADEKDYWDIISGQREFKIKNQDGFFGWWQNEIEQTGQFGVEPSYFAQVNNPDLNIYNANSHVDTWKKLQKIKDRFGPGIMEMAGYDIQRYNDAESEF